MHLDLHTLQVAAMLLVFLLLFAARLVKGSPRPTSSGLAFPLKPLVLFSRGVALPLYFLLFAYPLWISQQSIPAWLLILIFLAVLFGAYQFPGTIFLTSDSVTQRFWLRAHKVIRYSEITVIQAARTGAVTRVLGANRALIVHTFNHAASAQFRIELEHRSGKQLNY
jgi:hypothetical protein